MIFKSISFLLTFQAIYSTDSQLYFPEDSLSINPVSAYSVSLNADQSISEGISKLTIDIHRALSAQSTSSVNNIVYSPVSIAGALALILLASNGKTFEELAKVLGFSTIVDVNSDSQLVHEKFGRLLSNVVKTSGFQIGHQVNYAIGIFLQEDFTIRDTYRQNSENIYKSEVINVDFQRNSQNAQNVINNWVSKRTNSKIDSILAENPPSSTKVIIVSALYFKGEWEKPFFDGGTRRRPFYTNGRKNQSDKTVEMMSNGGSFPYYKDTILHCEIMGFPYKGNRTTMYVIVPSYSNRHKLRRLENSLTPTEIDRLVSSTKYTQSVVLFPKMKIESVVDLKGTLEYLGVRDLFDPYRANLALLSSGVKSSYNIPNTQRQFTQFNSASVQSPADMLQADNMAINQTYENEPVLIFSRLSSENVNSIDNIRRALNSNPQSTSTENPGLFADQILHKVYMDITESGTEAAAVTSVSLSRDGGRVTFRVDVPFLFFIRHEETKLVLFWGSVSTPTPYFS